LIEYKDERCDDLRLRLFSGPLDLNTFPVLERRSIRLPSCAIDASIIGASHAVQFKIGDKILTEVLACGPAAVRQHDHQLVGVWRLGDAVQPEPFTELSYSFASELISLDDAESALANLRRAMAVADGAASIGLSFQFPSVDETRAAETILWVDVSKATVAVRSAHVYPAENVVVFSQSRVAVPETLGRVTSQTELVRA
jgi:hypothetical protein